MSFRIGRTRAQHTYPESRSNQGSLPFANSSGEGPADPVDILNAAGTLIPWGSRQMNRFGIGVLAAPTVGIAARVSGKFRVVVMLGFANEDNAAHTVQVRLEDATGAPYPNQVTALVTVPAGGAVQIPFVYTIGGANNPPTALGTDATIQVRAIADAATFITAVAESCFLDAQETA
jgi:hypothetical protein